MKPWIFAAMIVGIMITLVVSCKYDDVVLIEPDHISFNEDILPFFNTSCTTSGCHNGTIAPDLRSTAAYESLWGATLIDTLAPANSELYLWMSGAKGLPMPPDGVNAIYAARVLQWIEEGALNN